ncbi:preprotein translocase subunit YajC [Clostridium acetobutylicum]|uniref:Uncharacterized secreted protein, YajC family n=1 Tax=Clostridium acetobutylicum (strain ATCC 824 / DSM 792 / JCM 1419 / IAM 19013 / LMG 5710 / NBRC 13948 / NRRL B-527 / VKM B-1787 / 2291 / W) TaxID=272562 RepID=Q97GT4_CLOAB|nr:MULTISPECIES: preprotein translocase subunit YajC [Clostridium]AAK80238.1 Uncharacterized secreted protein, YajC family [Clostridium acetobutylicum ATCC 824]ADZ21334.1 preprotein translocase subunit YajC [Clostridium acetobutylicum EA 2018]AEI33044.1 preprotein translocase subunit YajC [Clostridium acetobutylicum DSM 1731]AWV79338.1 preprotein translocase subunit YajC [Clostridium acetobutylicum]MBC2394691.1 preprotein translocase subunit YajC [Clostridium acetobutylicum]
MPNTVLTILYVVFLLGMFYVAMYIPDRAKKKKFNKMLSEMRVNDKVVTTGGIMGQITNIQEQFVIIQTGPDKVKIKIKKEAIATVETRKADNQK